jgi:hypothetical protein
VSAPAAPLVVSAPVTTLPVAVFDPAGTASVSARAVGTSSMMLTRSDAAAVSPSTSVTTTAKVSPVVSPEVLSARV